ncbi:MAG: O-antigen ligase family protein [Actinomycetota bacterium]
MVAGLQSTTQPRTAVLIVAIAIGLLLLVLAYVRFEAFLLTTLVVRASVDWTKTPSELGEPTRSGTMTAALALIFLAAAVVWLLVQFRAGRLVAPSLLSLAWLAFLGISIVSAAGADLRLESLAESGRIATAVAMLLVLHQLLGDGTDVRRVLTACYVSAVVPLSMAAYQALSGGVVGSDEAARVYGTFAHPNAFGFYLTILIVMGVALLRHVTPTVRPLLLAFLWGSSIAIVLTYSRGAWIALIVGLLVVGALQSARAVLITIGVAVVVALTLPPVTERLLDLRQESSVPGTSGNSLQWRFDYWGRVVDLADENPILGIGPKMTQYVTDSAKVPHNDFLRAYAETGVLGLCAYAAVLAALVHSARRSLRGAAPGFDRGIAVGFAGCVAAMLAFSVGGNLMSQVVVLWYFAAFAAVAIAVTRPPTRPGRTPGDRQTGPLELPPPPVDVIRG